MAKKQFKAESKRLLDLMINSIYTHKEIFLREIISNASDAMDKLCYRSLTDEKVQMAREDFHVRVSIDREARTITVSDNGIGMTGDDMERNLGVIAHSGSRDFREALGEGAEHVDIIGQFGVGFYSAFMVSDRVTVVSRAYGAEKACRWESAGADGYTIAETEKEGVGTDVVMHLKPDSDSENYSIFLDPFELENVIKKYSDYIRWPIVMDLPRTELRETGEKDGNGDRKKEYVTVQEERTVNSMVPIWERAKSEADDRACMDFYKEKFGGETDPVAVIRVSAEGQVSYRALLFIPEKAPYDFYSRDAAVGLELYSTGVMIMERCADLLPYCFRFVRGVVDSPDLSLNISRELLQHDRQLRVIESNIEKKVKNELKRLMENEREKYERFYRAFGRQLKYGVVSDFGVKKDLLTDLLLFPADESRMLSFKEYAAGMKEGQKAIYYGCAESVKRVLSLPQAEQVKARGYDILCLTEEIDDFVMQIIGDYEGKKLINISSGDLGLESEDEKADSQKKAEEAKDVLEFASELLKDEVSAVRLSGKLVNSPVCLTTEGEVTLEMERYFREFPGAEGAKIKAKRVLELNASHPAFEALRRAYGENREKAAGMVRILLGQAMLLAGEPLEDPTAYTELVCGLF